MKINELFESSDQAGYWSPGEDQLETRNLSDHRKSYLSLRHLNRLRQMREAKKLDLLKQRTLLQPQYSPGSGGESSGIM